MLASRIGNGEVPVKHSYRAQIYEDGNDDEPVWTCVHDHRTPIDAQLCGVQFLTDRPSMRRQPGAA